MRGATECARKLKTVLNSLRSKLGKIALPVTGDPVTQLVLGILSRDVPESKALDGLERLRSLVVDYNELRVIPPIEMAETLSDFPDQRLKCEDISRALNAIFAQEHTVTLDHVAAMSSKDALTYLNKIDGLEAYTVARIRLLGLGQPGFPLDEAMFAYAQHVGIVHPKGTHEEAQHFLERQIPEDRALEAYAMIRKQAWSEFATQVRKGQVVRIRSVPPDRTTRNMLQAISAAAGGTAVVDDIEPDLADVVPFEPELATAPLDTPARSAAPRSAKATKAGAATNGVESKSRHGEKPRPTSKRPDRPARAKAAKPKSSTRARAKTTATARSTARPARSSARKPGK